MQNWHSQTRDGLMDGELLSSWLRIATDMSKTAGFQRVWEQRKHIYLPALRDYLEAEIFAKESFKEYEPPGVARR